MTEVLDDDALLNTDDARDVTSSDLDDDQIAVLLARDISDREENVETLKINGESSDNTNAVTEPIAQEVLLRPDADDEGFEEAPDAANQVEVLKDDDVEEIAESSEGSVGSSIVDEHVEDLLATDEQVEQNGESNEIVVTSDTDDNDVVEDFEDESEEVEEDSSGQGSSTRKRAGSSSSPKAPAHKRNRPERPFFEGRQKVIEAVSGIYGSWDASLNVSQIHVLADLRKKHYEEIIDLGVKSESDLRSEVLKLQKERESEDNLKTIVKKNLEQLTKDSNSMRGEIDSLSRMITQPPVAEQCLDGEENTATNSGPQHVQPRLQRYPSNMSSVSQQNTPRHQRALQQPPQTFYQQAMALPTGMDPIARQQLEHQRAMDRAALLQQIHPQMNGTLRGNVLIRGAPQHVNQRTPSQMLQRSQLEMGVPMALPRANYNTQSPQQPKFHVLPRANTSMGHTLPSQEGLKTQELMDLTKDSWICLCVPLVPLGLVISSGDCARLPILPKMLTSLDKCPDLSVSILSSANDFRENWQIAGKINYEMMGNLEHKTIQIYVQVASLKAAGIHGKPTHINMLTPVNWGISKEWPCKTKSHKFRLQFHQQQTLPHNDRITIVVVAKDRSNGKIEISETTYLNLGG
ncbi:unnamed protein product [Caenorhabditis brenneri]